MTEQTFHSPGRPGMPRFATLLFITLVFLAAGRGQVPVDSAGTFDIRHQGTVVGSEDYNVVATKQGFRLTSSIHIAAGGVATTMQQEQTLSPEWGLLRYLLKADPQQATIEAWTDGDKVQMSVETAGQSIPKTAALAPHTLVVDNNVPSHFQVLLNQFAMTPGAKSQEFQLLVPQVLLPIRVTVALAGTDKGTLDGTDITLTRYEMTFGAMLTEIWADDHGRLMRIVRKGSDSVRRGLKMAESQPPLAPANSSANEKRLNFPSGTLQIPATLLLPAEKPAQTKHKFPVIVLVGGSGPHDRDETIGPNKPFLDLAEGLAARGIATLRYDKRTFAFRGKLDFHKVTVQDEIIDDAVAALRYVRSLPEIEAGKVFLLGHSQGAQLAPFILQQEPQASGAILMAAPGRPLDQLLLEQIEFQGRAQGNQDAARKEINDLKPKFAAIRDGTLPDSEIVLGAPVSYWRDLFKRDQMAALHTSKVPLLVLQGGRDVQILSKDYDLVTAAIPPPVLEKHLFPELNHLFMTATQGATGEEIMTTPGHVSAEVIDVIAAWVSKQKNNDDRKASAR